MSVFIYYAFVHTNTYIYILDILKINTEFVYLYIHNKCKTRTCKKKTYFGCSTSLYVINQMKTSR